VDEWVWSNGWIILIGENWSTGRNILYSVGGRWMNEYGAMVEWYWQGKAEVLGEKHYTAWVVDGWKSMEQWWNDIDRRKLKYLDKNLSQCHLVHHKFHTDWPRIEARPPQPPASTASSLVQQRTYSKFSFLHIQLSLTVELPTDAVSLSDCTSSDDWCVT